MNISVTFHISVSHRKTGKTFRMLTEHYYSSPQVERFKINGKNDRFILMEKRLDNHRQPWRIVEGEIDSSNVEQTALAIFDIQVAIDKYLDQRKREGGGVEGHSLPDREF